MTFWQWLTENKTKILGTLSTIVAALLSMIAMGMFAATATMPALIDEGPMRWMTIGLSLLNVALGGGTIAAGVANTHAVRIEEAKAEVATAITTALNTPAPP
jgi:hypothetical protein